MNKRKLKYFIIGMSVLFLMPIYSHAYFTDDTTLKNDFQMGGNRIEIVEEFNQPNAIEPGTVITKKIQIKNIGISECFVRIKAVFTTSDMQKICHIDWNEEDWILKDDNFYYYKHLLRSKETSNPLFTQITIPEDTEASLIQAFDVLVYAESCHAEVEDNYETVWKKYQTNRPEGDE